MIKGLQRFRQFRPVLIDSPLRSHSIDMNGIMDGWTLDVFIRPFVRSLVCIYIKWFFFIVYCSLGAIKLKTIFKKFVK